MMLPAPLIETLLQTPLRRQWQSIGIKPHHGINILLSSVRTKNSRGIGEFFDLLPLIDWCACLGMDLIQLLPLTDSGDDPSPYFAMSGSALNPIFLSLHKLPGFFSSKSLSQMWANMEHFNQKQRVEYTDVKKEKLTLLRSYFIEQGHSILDSSAFRQFQKQYPWIRTYALFKALKQAMNDAYWGEWPKELRCLTPELEKELIKKHEIEVTFHLFLQYLCYNQLTSVKAYAKAKGVLLKGDLPLLISDDSVDVWVHRFEFDLTLSAGTPPDVYAPHGQAWGLPIPKWEEMEKNDYAFWKERLQYASAFYDLYRLDHVLGFFRLWAIPKGKSSEEGSFIPSDETLWTEHGKKLLLSLASKSTMLPLAEDLGFVFDGLRPTLCELGICGTKVIRWERELTSPYRFIDPSTYSPLSMSTVSTHDSETLSLWWQQNPEEAKAYAKQKGWSYSPVLTQAERYQILFESHHTASLFHINLLGEYLALFPELVWESFEDERINVPGTISSRNWTYRMRPFLEEIISHAPLKETMQRLLSQEAVS